MYLFAELPDPGNPYPVNVVTGGCRGIGDTVEVLSEVGAAVISVNHGLRIGLPFEPPIPDPERIPESVPFGRTMTSGPAVLAM